MDLRVLRYFLAVAREKNFTKAAKVVLVSQPALSRQLAELETELGVKLFNRGYRQVTLTQQGRYLEIKAKQILNLVDQTTANITAEQIISGDITIGAGESAGIKYVNNVLTDIHGDYPDVKIHLISGNTEEMVTALDQGRIDFAILVGNYPVTNYDYLQLPKEDRWGIVIRKEDTLAQKSNIQPKDLLKRQLIVPQQTIDSHTFQKWWGNLGNKINIMATYTLVYNARTLIQTNYSCMLSIEGLIDNTHDSKLVFRPLNPVMTEPLTIIWKKNILLSKAAQLFKQRLSATLK